MKNFRPHRFPPLAQLTAADPLVADAAGEWQSSLSEGFEQGRREGYEAGLEKGRQDGFDTGRSEGLQQGHADGRRETLVSFDSLASPLDAALNGLKTVQADYQSALRKEVVDLVAKVARQVIRCELALQPTQLLALVDETLAAMPPVREGIEVYLNPAELQRILEVDPERARSWSLIPDTRLEAGECRVKAGDHEADAGCKQRLAACIEQVSTQLLDEAEAGDGAQLKVVRQAA
ncbi:flagellar assembly protein H [Noviherbaspirillum cavernae]|uniref:Flagellar assembly protein FliH n=1 Tax=Noviherbaspirillum cavernae TaxID=2320862 RepID=A0A418WVJ3_9BURK|nr:flagellar assembly protein FliH [Noviherbaspirillum cavernae]RJF96705.1 flagellar assembly protein H [Noviherbaspirillum cavernae]